MAVGGEMHWNNLILALVEKNLKKNRLFLFGFLALPIGFLRGILK